MISALSRTRRNRTALPFVLAFLIVYGGLFVYPTLQMMWISLTDGQLILRGEFAGIDNFPQLSLG